MQKRYKNKPAVTSVFKNTAISISSILTCTFFLSFFTNSIRFDEIRFFSLYSIFRFYISTFKVNLTKHISRMAHMRTAAFSVSFHLILSIYIYIHYMCKSFSIRFDANLFSQSGNIHSNIFIRNVLTHEHSATAILYY